MLISTVFSEITVLCYVDRARLDRRRRRSPRLHSRRVRLPVRRAWYKRRSLGEYNPTTGVSESLPRSTDMEQRNYGADAVEAAAVPANWEIWPAPERHPEVLYQHFPEFTCLCPRSSYPDFAAVHLVIVPDKKVVELKHLKLWLNSYRERAISHELATAEIVDTLASVLDLHYAFVLMHYT